MENRIVKMKAGAITTLSGLNDNKGRDRTWSEVDLLTDRSARCLTDKRDRPVELKNVSSALKDLYR